MLNILRTAAARIADALIQEGKKKEAIEVLDHCMKNISEKSYLYSVSDEDRNLVFISDAYLRAGAKDKAKAINDKLYKYLRDDIAYSKTLKEGSAERETKEADLSREARMLAIRPQGAMMVGDSSYARELSNKLQEMIQGSGMPNPFQQEQR
jgi:tetratricopeptide (TPR) repeat protein